MTPWRPQAFRNAARTSGVDQLVITNAVETAEILLRRTPNAQPIFSLKHLSELTSIQYVRLRDVVSRRGVEPYRVFKLRKRPLPDEEVRFRTIVVPSPWLMTLQRWINASVLEGVRPHEASVAYSTGDTIREAANRHCGCKWLIKIDIRNFFESVTEAQVYRVFESLGYQPLVSFELARLCTRVGDRKTRSTHVRYRSEGDSEIAAYNSTIMGHLPQGAPTSPRIANLVAKDLDRTLMSAADEHALTYTRYADDLIFSTRSPNLNRSKIRTVIGDVYARIAAHGFTPNTAKTVVAPPGARKVVLGLLVDTEAPHLTREYKSSLRQHLHFLRKTGFGPTVHSPRKGGTTVYGMRRHVLGLIQHARQIEPAYGDARLAEFNQIEW